MTPPGTQIVNQATVSYDGTVPDTATSNPVVVVVVPLPARAALELQHAVPAGAGAPSIAGPTACQGPGGWAVLPPPVPPDGARIDPTQPVPLASAERLNGGEPLFLRLADADRNLDATAIDTVELDVTTASGDRERLRLSENGADTGIFVGYIQTQVGAAVPGDCVLDVASGDRIDALYADPRDPSDTAADSAPVDVVISELFVQKSAASGIVAVGDFARYTLTVENVSTVDAVAGLRTLDRLPAGLRYRPGSTRVNGAAAADPAISADGRELRFDTGALAAGARVTIGYVVEVTGAARGRKLVNAAQAFGPDGAGSNVARATIQLREELFRERAILMGRVVEGGCAADAGAAPGVAGVRVYLEDGRYVTTDAEGKYHFEDLEPGTHVAQLDTLTIPGTHETQDCPDDLRQAGRGYSRFVELRGGALWRADFRLARRPLPAGTVQLGMETRRIGTEAFEHRLTLRVDELGVRESRVLVMLPEGLAYRAGSTVAGRAAAPDPAESAGVLSFPLGELAAGSESLLQFATMAAEGADATLTLRAVASFSTPAKQAQSTAPIENRIQRQAAVHQRGDYRFTPRFEVFGTEIQPADRAALDRIAAEWRRATDLQLTVVGHADRLRIAARSRGRYPDNYALSQARAEAVARYLTERLPVDPARVSVSGRGPDEPLAAGRDATSLAQNRRVEITIEGTRLVTGGRLELAAPAAESEPLPTQGVLAGQPAEPAAEAALRPRLQPAATTGFDVEALPPGIEWILPAQDDVPPIPSIKVAIRHLLAQQVELSVNGVPAHTLNFDGVSINESRTVAVSRWRGVDLKDGDNELIAVVRDGSGVEVRTLRRHIHYAGGAVRAELLREASRLVADGRMRPVIALAMADVHGRPARPGTQGAFRVGAPYRSWWEVASLHENKLVAVGNREPTFSVDDDGIARLVLEPTTQAGTAVIQLRFNERHQQELRVWLEPEARDWILVGLAEGTAAWDALSGHAVSAEAAGLDEGYESEGRLAFFAKGAVKGEYLLTVAYDSARSRSEAKERLLGVVEPDRYYTLYGDAAEQRAEAASQRKLYLKLERRQFAALFGDYETGLTVTELTRYSRTMNGLKADYAGGRWGLTAFAADSEQGFVRDEIEGDGSSGLYRLTRRPLVVNSDKLRLEVRDRFHSERVLDSRPLTRHVDYDVDYLAGTLFFKRPVPSRDTDFNPVWIVAEYEVLSGGRSEVTAGARGSVQLQDGALELGASLVEEGAAAGDTRVAGLDLRWQLGEATRLRAELARSDSGDATRPDDATAYLAEVLHVTGALDVRAYLREQEAGYGTGQQTLSESGTRKLGADGRYRLSERLRLEGEAYRQTMLSSGAERDFVSTAVRYEAANHALGAGLRHVSDSGLAGRGTTSDLGFVSGRIDLLDDRVTLRASQDVALGGRRGSVDYPARSLLGVDWHWRPGSTLFTEVEHAEGRNLDADLVRVGMRTAPWQQAQLQSTMTHQATEYGPRVFANLGLTHRWQLGERWGVDTGVDQSRTLRGPDLEPLNPAAPLASGTLADDFLATWVGTMYRSELWTFTSRVESRQADAEDRLGLMAGFYREPVAGRAFTAGLQLLDSDFANGATVRTADLQLGWAWRPVGSRWILLDRLDLRREAADDDSQRRRSTRFVNNLNANLELDPRSQLGLQFGSRYVESSFDGERYDGFSVLAGADWRRDLDRRFDVGVHGTTLHSLESGTHDYALGADLGVTLWTNVWISLGYNLVGFHDDDFEASRYTAQGPYLRFRIKADQDTLKNLLKGDRAL